MSHDTDKPQRRQGHKALRVNDGELETFDQHPGTKPPQAQLLFVYESISPNAWGALTRTLALSNRIRDTERTAKMQDPSSHARRTPIWRWA